MRERLLAAFVALTLLTALLYAVPRSLLRASAVAEEAQREVEVAAEATAAVVSAATAAGRRPGPVRLAFLDEHDQVLLRDVRGTEQVLAGPAEVASPAGVTARRTVPGGTVEVRRPQADLREQAVREVVPILLTGLAALAVAVLAALVLSARMARPFQRLAAQASSLGRGSSFELDLPTQPVREAEAIAEALRTSAARVAVMLQRERAFARNVSHQLRTPLTGVRLRVEDLSLRRDTPVDVRAELDEVLGEVDRLSETVTALLGLSRQEEGTAWQEVALTDVVAGVVRRWAPLAAASGRGVEIGDSSADTVAVPRVVLEQVLDVLVDNALQHGAGTVTVSAGTEAGGVRVEVRDEGSGITGEVERTLFRRRETRAAVPGSEGLGLALCADLVQAVGGRLVLTDRAPTTFAVLLPPAAG